MTNNCTCGGTEFLAKADIFSVGRFLWWFLRARRGSVVVCYGCGKVWVARRTGLTEPKWKQQPAEEAQNGAAIPRANAANDRAPRDPRESEADLKWRMRK